MYKNAFPESHFIGKVENINTEFVDVCQQVGLPKLNIPKINQTNHRSYQNYYNDGLKEKVFQIYSQDFELFDYKF